jgi:PIN domain nuclease of toxin-antitoxin system
LILLDTHVLVWLVQGDSKLGGKAQDALRKVVAEEGVLVSAISIWEVSMLAAKGRLILGRPTGQWVASALALPGIGLAPIEPMAAVEAGALPDSIRGDPADRIIIATARALTCPIATADRAILAYAKAGLVEALDVRR